MELEKNPLIIDMLIFNPLQQHIKHTRVQLPTMIYNLHLTTIQLILLTHSMAAQAVTFLATPLAKQKK
jgi:hypothetical protein